MATVTSHTAARIEAIEAAKIVSASIESDGHLRLIRQDEGVIDAGSVSMPAGVVALFGGGGIPDGWLSCEGQVISRSAYAALFSAIGTAYGAGDGSTTFKIPDFRQKFPRGDPSALGGTGGSTAHTHTVNQHTHTIDDHTHTINTHTHTINGHTHTTPNHDHQIDGGSSDALARVSMTAIQSPNFWMERIVADEWDSNVRGGGLSVEDFSSARVGGAKVVGTTATRSAGTTGSGGNNTNSGGNNTNSAGNDTNAGGNNTGAPSDGNPPYVGVNYIIKY